MKNIKIKAVYFLAASLLLASCGENGTSSSASSSSSAPVSSSSSSKSSSSSSSPSSSLPSSSSSSSKPSSSSSSSTSSTDDYKVKWVTPTGAPTLLFYNEGSNENWVSSSSPSTVVVPAFGNDNQDAIVFDGATGLTLLKKNGYNYQLASWLTGGNFYVVSAKYTKDKMVKENVSVDAFVKTGSASLVFNRLAKESWNMTFSETFDYESGVADVKNKLVSNPTGYDYYVIAEPVLTAATKALKDAGTTLNVIYNLQTEWNTKYNQTTIPAAALFINKTSYANHKGAMDSFIEKTKEATKTAVEDPATVAAGITSYSADTTKQQSRFGFTAALATALQKDGANRFGVIKDGTIEDKRAFVNDYEVNLGTSLSFDPSLFL